MDDIKKELANTTEKEKSFLDGIVAGKWVKEHSAVRAKEALSGYINTAFNRVWDDGVSATAVNNHAKRLLAEIAKG